MPPRSSGAATPVPDARLEYLWEAFRWRFSAHVPPWDLARIEAELDSFDDWCRVWTRWAERHERLGDEAAARDRRVTAGDAYLRAALLLHFASFLFPHEPDQFRAALAAMERVWRKAAPRVEPPMELLDVPFEGVDLPGYLRLPPGVERPPLAVIVPGGDSTKEEFFAFGTEMLRRGIAVFGFDGPGHGAVSLRLKMRVEYEPVVAAALDRLWQHGGFDEGRVAVGGFSYGGVIALRAAAVDPRIAAVFSCFSWYSPAGRYDRGHPVSQAGVRQYMGDDPPSVQDRITVADVASRVSVPVLQLYGERDHLSKPEEALRVERELAGPTTTLVLDDAVHVANNVPYVARAALADWLAETLR